MILVLLFLAFLFYQPSLSYYFISDDFLLFKQKGFFDLLKINPLNNHYTPVNNIIDFFLYKIFGLNPLPYHAFAILIHLLNIYLIYELTKLLISEVKIPIFLPALLFALFFANYEVVYWFGATNNSLLVTFYLISLMSLINYVKTRKIFYYFVFQVGFCLAFFTHEYAVSLIFVGFAYWWLFSRQKTLKEFFKLFLAPIFIFSTTSILKLIFVKMPLVVRTPSILKFIAFTLRSFVYLFIPNPYLIDKLPNVLIPLISLIIFIFLLKLTKNKQTLFLLIWAALTIFIYSLTSAPQARYFYLSSIPVIILILSKRHETGPATLYLLFFLISGIVFLQNQKYYWQLSSQITKNVIRDLKKYQTTVKKTDTLYFINLPDSSNDSIWKAYVFRAGFKELLNNFAHIYPQKIVYLRSFQPAAHTIEAPYVNPDKLKSLSKENQVFLYNERLKTIVLLKD